MWGCLVVTQSMGMKYNDIRTAPFHPNIHNFGNTGPLGRFHAITASLATKVIDRFAYDGINMRHELASHVSKSNPGAIVLEVGCGVGTLTRELTQANLTVFAIDTSKEMIDQAKLEVPNQNFTVMNGVDVQDYFSGVDITIACMLMHEMPKSAHVDLINAFVDVTKSNGEIWIVDIDPSYKPSEIMLSGEPYILKYLHEFGQTISDVSTDRNLSLVTWSVIPNHVTAYILRNDTHSSN